MFLATAAATATAQATFPSQEPADPTTSAELPASLSVKKAVLEAEALFTQEKYAEALKAYETIYNKQSQEAWICYRLSILYNESFQQSINQKPSNNNTSELHANVVTFAAKAVEKEPKNHIYLLHLAQLYHHSYPHKSAQLYQQAIQLKPRNSSIYLLAAEHAAKQFRNQSNATPTPKSPPLSPFTDTLLHIAQQYRKQFGLTNAYLEMMVFTYSRMPNKQSAKDSLIQEWNAVQLAANPPTPKSKSTNAENTAVESTLSIDPHKTPQIAAEQTLPAISRKIHQSDLLFQCAQLYNRMNQPEEGKKVMETFNQLEENFPYLDWSISRNYFEKNIQNSPSEFPITWPSPAQLSTLNPTSALLIWQNIGYLSTHLTAAPTHFQPLLLSLEALEKHQSANPQNYKQTILIIEYLLKTLNSSNVSQALIPHLNQYKKVEDFK